MVSYSPLKKTVKSQRLEETGDKKVIWKRQTDSFRNCPKNPNWGQGCCEAHPQQRTSYWKLLWTESCSLGGTGWFCRRWNVCEAYGISPDLPSLLVFSWVIRRPTTNSTERPLSSWCSGATNSFACYWCNSESAELFHCSLRLSLKHSGEIGDCHFQEWFLWYLLNLLNSRHWALFLRNYFQCLRADGV